MRMETASVVLRDFAAKDAESLCRIVREPEIARFMHEWVERCPTVDKARAFIDAQQALKDAADIQARRWLAIALPDSDDMVGMVGVGLHPLLREVEITYFMSEKYQWRGFTRAAVKALCSWCFSVSDIPYLILVTDSANTPSGKLAESCGFTLLEKRTPVGRAQKTLVSGSYDYYRLYRPD